MLFGDLELSLLKGLLRHQIAVCLHRRVFLDLGLDLSLF